MTTAYRISCRGKSWKFREGSLLRLENHTWGRKSLKGMRNRLLKIWTFITCHYIILTSILYRVRALTSHNTEESENSPDSPHLGEIKRTCKQCVPGAPPFFTRAGDEADGSDNGCDSELLRVAFNKQVTFPGQTGIHPLGSCCSVWGMYNYYLLYMC